MKHIMNSFLLSLMGLLPLTSLKAKIEIITMNQISPLDSDQGGGQGPSLR